MVLRILFFFLFSTVCAVSNAQGPLYKVKKIKATGQYYVIYAIKNDSTFKIVSKKEKINDCRRIRKNESYPLDLSKIQALGGSEVDCISFGKSVICKEPDIQLMVANNLKGLCLIEK